ncbi:MAG: peptide chain release factor N(5)-glutamine methyltransferase [Ferruginibacter sp.]
MPLKEYYRHYLEQLQHIYNLDEASAIAKLLFEEQASLKRSDIVKHPDYVLPAPVTERLDNALQRLLQNEPIQYILGETFFCGLKIKVNHHVLIPRPETEELASWILEEETGRFVKENYSILDIGTGSGCIAIALKKNLIANVSAIDQSAEALATAKENAAANETDIHFIQLDFLSEDQWQKLPSFDIIVSNPPYIPVSEEEKMDKNVTLFEPHAALFVPADSPLLFYEKIARFATAHLKPGGKIFAELHEEYANATGHLFSKTFSNVEVKKDMSGKNRMLKANQFR